MEWPFSYAELRRLPTTPRALLHTIARASIRSTMARSAPHFGPALRTLTEFETVRDLLIAPVSPAVRSVLYRATALIPGVRYLGSHADAFGRVGVEIGLEWRGGSSSS